MPRSSGPSNDGTLSGSFSDDYRGGRDITDSGSNESDDGPLLGADTVSEENNEGI
jgi:hypothetical protein